MKKHVVVILTCLVVLFIVYYLLNEFCKIDNTDAIMYIVVFILNFIAVMVSKNNTGDG